jgi:hypothetical protein
MRILELPLDEIVIGERIRKRVGSVLQLQGSIQKVGLLHPLVLDSNRRLVAGFRRLQAVRELGWKTVPCVLVESLDDAILAIRAEKDENTCRENMDPTEIVAAGRMIEELEKERARERQAQAGPASGRGKKMTGSGNLPEPVTSGTGDTRDKVGSAFGISGKTYEKAKQVVEAAEKAPEEFGDLPEKMDRQSIDAAYREMARRRSAAAAQPAPASDPFGYDDDQDDPPIVGMTPAQVAAIDDIEQSSRNYDHTPEEKDDTDWHTPVEADTDDDPDGMKAHERELDRIEAEYLAEKAAEREAEDRRDRERRAAEREAVRRKALEDLAARAEDSDRWEIRLGDCASGMHEGTHGIARLVFADPPYNIGWDYGDGKKADLITPHHFLTWCKGWLNQIPKVLTPDGSFWLLISDEFAAEVKIAAEDAGLYLRQWLIWYESFGVNTTRKFNPTTPLQVLR